MANQDWKICRAVTKKDGLWVIVNCPGFRYFNYDYGTLSSTQPYSEDYSYPKESWQLCNGWVSKALSGLKFDENDGSCPNCQFRFQCYTEV